MRLPTHFNMFVIRCSAIFKEPTSQIDSRSELKVQQALLRRALAADQAGLVTFNVLEAVHQSFLAHLNRQAPPGFDRPSIASVLRADKELCKLVPDEAGSRVKRGTDGVKPLDALFKKLASDPSVLFNLLPTPSAKRSSSHVDQSERPRKQARVSNASKPSGPRARVPRPLQGLSTRAKQGKPFCFNSNLPHGCQEITRGDPLACAKGLHLCMRCGGAHGQHECDR